jgi:acetyltransferase-like isoleucine patch superfamily enzyme
MKSLMKSVGARSRFSSDSHFDNFSEIHLGNDVFINRNFYCSNEKAVYIRDRVMFGSNCSIVAGDHDYDNPNENLRLTSLLGDNREIVIEEDAWIGHGTVILKRGYISEGCIVGAYSVVNSKLLPYTVYVGNPLKNVKPRFKTYEELMNYLSMMKEKYHFESNYTPQELKKIYEL